MMAAEIRINGVLVVHAYYRNLGSTFSSPPGHCAYKVILHRITKDDESETKELIVQHQPNKSATALVVKAFTEAGWA